jgi:hypothetical protein
VKGENCEDGKWRLGVCRGYIDSPDENAFVTLVGKTNEFFPVGVHERGEKHVE